LSNYFLIYFIMNKYKCGEKVTLNIWNSAFKCTIVALKHDIFLRKNRMGIMPIGALSIAFSSYLLRSALWDTCKALLQWPSSVHRLK